MDRISQLSDDFLLQILSLVPTKDVVATSLVSKKWHSLSSLVSRLRYSDVSYNDDYSKFTLFVYRTLQSNKAPVLDLLYLHLSPKCQAIDIKIWIETAIAHRLRELRVRIRSGSPVRLPRSLFTCKTLETLTLKNCFVPDVNCFLPSVKTIRLWNVAYASLPKLLAGCPNLEKLIVMRDKEEHEGEDIVVAVPCSRKLVMKDVRNESNGGAYMIEAPCLEKLKIVDDVFSVSRRIKYMPNLVKAHVDITQGITHKFLRALSSARTLYLSVSLISKVPSTIIFFSRLVHLELNTCARGWWDLLSQMLENSPKLVSLILNYQLDIPSRETPQCWKWPRSIPDSLETLQWNGYKGRKGDFEMAIYLIKNATGLKTAIFYPQSEDPEANYRMLEELETCICSPRSTDVDPKRGMFKDLVARFCSPRSNIVETKYRVLKASVAEFTLHLFVPFSPT